MKPGVVIILVVLFLIVGWQVYNLYLRQSSLKNEVSSLSQEADALAKEREKLLADIEYFSDSRNLVKEFKSKYNYKNPGEKLIIVVPQ